MTKEEIKKKTKKGQILSIVQWFVLFIAGFLAVILFPIYNNGKSGWWGIFFPIFMGVIHSIEAIAYGIPTGKKYGYTVLESLCLTWLYGFTWWKYLRQEKALDEK